MAANSDDVDVAAAEALIADHAKETGQVTTQNTRVQFEPPPASPAPAAVASTDSETADAEALLAAHQNEQAAAIPAQKQEESALSRLWGKVKETVDPTKTEAEGGVINPELEKLPDWTLMAPWASHPINSLHAGLGTLISSIDETKDVIEEQFPGTKVEKAGKNKQYLVITPRNADGTLSDQKYAWKPGIRASDFARAALTIPVAGAGVAAANAGLAAAIPGTALSALGSTLTGGAMLELQKYAAGGGFNPNNLAGAALLHEGMSAAGNVAGRALRTVRGWLPGGADAAVGAEGAAILPGSPAAAEAPVMAQPELAKKMAAAGRGDSAAQAIVDGQVKPNPELVAGAKDLTGADGRPLIDSLTPAHLSTNPVYQRLANAIPGAEGSHIEAVRGMGDALSRALDVAGTPGNQGAAETVAKKAISDRLTRYKQLVDHLYERLEALTPKTTKTPVPEFNSAIEALRDDLGTLPKAVENFRKELFNGAKDGIPTRGMVDRMRRMAGADIGKGGKKYGLDAAHKMYDALNAAYDVGAAGHSEEAADLLRRGKLASQTLRDMQELTDSVLGDRLQNSLTDKLSSQVETLPHGPDDEFARTISVAPESLRAGLAKQALRQFVKENGDLDVRGFNSWYKAMEGNRASWNALKLYIGQDLADNLEMTGKISRNVEAAIRAAKPRDFKGTFPDTWDLPGMAKRAIQFSLLGKVPVPGEAKYAIADRILSKRDPLDVAIGEYLSSPGARAFMTAETKGAVSPELVRATMGDSKFRAMMNAAGIHGADSRQKWLQDGANQNDKTEDK